MSPVPTVQELRQVFDILTRLLEGVQLASGRYVYLSETRREIAEQILLREVRS